MAKEESMIKLEEQRLKLQTEQAKNVNKLMEKGLPLVEKYFSTKLEKLEAPRFKWMLIIFGGILVLSVALTGFLTFFGNLLCSTFYFCYFISYKTIPLLLPVIH